MTIVLNQMAVNGDASGAMHINSCKFVVIRGQLKSLCERENSLNSVLSVDKIYPCLFVSSVAVDFFSHEYSRMSTNLCTRYACASPAGGHTPTRYESVGCDN